MRYTNKKMKNRVLPNVEDELYEINVRVWKFFREAGISTLDDLTHWYMNTTMGDTPKGMGIKTYKEIENVLILNNKIEKPLTKATRSVYQIVGLNGIPANNVIYKKKSETKEPIETLKKNYGDYFEVKMLTLN